MTGKNIQMGKRNIKLSGETSHSSSGHKSYSIAEIIASGGATAFANKKGKRPHTIADQFKKLPADAFLSTEEATRALEMLNEKK